MGASVLWLAMAAAISGQVQSGACTPACRTEIRATIRPDKATAGQPGRYFLGIFPVHEGRPVFHVGGYFDGRDWVVSERPVAFAARPIGPVNVRATVRQGVCARARAAGAQSTRFVVAAGYGIDTVAAADREAGQDSGDALDEATRDQIAAVSMIQGGTYQIVGEVVCE